MAQDGGQQRRECRYADAQTGKSNMHSTHKAAGVCLKKKRSSLEPKLDIEASPLFVTSHYRATANQSSG